MDLQSQAEPSPSRRGGRRSGYPRPLAEYAKVYGYTAREIKRWIAKGREADPEDLPPLEDPGAMIGWWGRHNKRKVPARLQDAAGVPSTGPDPEPAVERPSAPPPEPACGGAVGEGHQRTFVENLENTRRAVSSAYLEWQRMAPGEAGAAAARARWMDLSEHLRKLEKDLQPVLAAQGSMVERDKVSRALSDIHRAIATGVRSIGRRLGFPREIETKYQQELDRLFSIWQGGDFSGA